MTNSLHQIPAGWQKTNLGEVLKIKHGFAFGGDGITDKPAENILLTPGNFLVGGGWKDGKKYFNGTIPKDYILSAGDLIVTMTDLSKDADTLGYPAMVPCDPSRKFLHNQRVGLVIVDEDKAQKKFIYYLLKHPEYQRFVVNSATGSTVRHTSPTRIQSFEFCIPQISEQESITKILSSLDEKIELLRVQNKTLETFAQTIFKEWFVNFNFPGATGRVMDSELGLIPERWRVGKLGEVTKSCGGTTPSTTNRNFWDGDIHWTSPKDLSNCKETFLLDTDKKITEEGLKQISSGLLPIGTLLLSSRAPIGYLALANIEVAINQGYIAFFPGQTFSNYFMYLWLKQYMDVVVGSANGSTFLEISKSSFRNIDCVVPHREILSSFEETITPVFEKVLNNIKQVKTLTKLRDVLLPKLMSGEIRVKPTRNGDGQDKIIH